MLCMFFAYVQPVEQCSQDVLSKEMEFAWEWTGVSKEPILAIVIDNLSMRPRQHDRFVLTAFAGCMDVVNLLLLLLGSTHSAHSACSAQLCVQMVIETRQQHFESCQWYAVVSCTTLRRNGDIMTIMILQS